MDDYQIWEEGEIEERRGGGEKREGGGRLYACVEEEGVRVRGGWIDHRPCASKKDLRIRSYLFEDFPTRTCTHHITSMLRLCVSNKIPTHNIYDDENLNNKIMLVKILVLTPVLTHLPSYGKRGMGGGGVYPNTYLNTLASYDQ